MQARFPMGHDHYRFAQHLAVEVVEKYRARGKELPLPFVEREALVKAQDEAIEHRFAGHTDLEQLQARVRALNAEGVNCRYCASRYFC